MSADQFLALLEERHLLADKHVVSLRRQIDVSTKDVTAESIAKLLVKKGMLTKFQAKQLLASKTPETSDPGETIVSDVAFDLPPPPPPLIESGPPSSDEQRDLDDLDLMPADDEFDAPPPIISADIEENGEPDVTAPANDFPVAPSDTPHPDLDELTPIDQLEPIDGDDEEEKFTEDLLESDLAPVVGDEAIDGAIVGELLDGELLDDDEFDELSGQNSASQLPGGNAGISGRRMKVKIGADKSEWDTPLMLVGGGALAVLLIIGSIVYYLYFYQSGEQTFAEAEKQYESASFSNAIATYNEFLEEFPSHERASLARVHRGLAQLRQTMSGRDWQQSWEKAQEVVSDISGEADFHEVHDQFATLLPQIADGLTQSANNEPDVEKKHLLIESATDSINMLQTRTDVVPKKLRDEAKIKQLRSSLALIRRSMSSGAELTNVLSTMRRALTAGNVSEAYAARKQLLNDYPDLASDPDLAAMVRKVAEAEVQNVQTVEESQASVADEPASPIVASVAMANRQARDTVNLPEEVVLFQIQGSVYAFNTANGNLLWRRYVGVDYNVHPVQFTDGSQADYLLVDVGRNELVRVDSATGKLRWRFPVGQRFAAPAVVGRHALIADRSGRLIAVSLDSGDSPRHAIFPQPLPVTPAISPNRKYAYLIGEHSSIYVVSTDNLKCEQVVYQGHAAGTISVPPAVLLRTVLVVENWGKDASTLHVFRTDAEGASLEHVEEIRLDGRVKTPMIVEGRRVIVVTDKGQIKIFDVSNSNEASPLTLVAERTASKEDPEVRYTALNGNDLWVADSRLAKFVIQAAAGRITEQAFGQRFEDHVFDYPLRMIDNLLIVVRRQAGQAGWIVSAIDTDRRGVEAWTTQVAVPPVGLPIAIQQPPTIVVATSTGAIFRLDTDAISRKVDNQPLTVSARNTPVLAHRIDVGDGQTVYAGAAGSRMVLVYDPSDAQQPVHWQTLPDELTCAPSAYMGGLIAPTRTGQVFWIDATTGNQKSAPFQPTLSPNKPLNWRTPGLVGPDNDTLVLADGQGKLYVVGLKSNPAALISVSDPVDVAVPIVSRVATLGEVVFAVNRDNFLVTYSLPDLQQVSRTDLRASAAWGPHRVGKFVLAASGQNELFCFNASGNLVWNATLEDGPIAGMPLPDGEDFIVTTKRGIVVWLNSLSGRTGEKLDLGQPLATGPVPLGDKLVMVGHDGTLLVITKPAGP